MNKTEPILPCGCPKQDEYSMCVNQAHLRTEPIACIKESMKSVYLGKDNEVLPALINLHSSANSPVIFDCTYNRGKMWEGTVYSPLSMDIDPIWETDVVGDFTAIPFTDESLDILVFDPPHLPTNAGSVNSSKIWEKRYGITGNDPLRSADNINAMFLPFLEEAKRVLKPNGIILAKIADITHNHKYQWHSVDFVNAVRLVGLTPCDMVIKRDPHAGRLRSSKWKNSYHFRKAHCYWIVVRKGSCERTKPRHKYE